MQISHRNGSYEVSFQTMETCFESLPCDLRVITDANLQAVYGSHLARFDHVKVIEPGEGSKSLEVFGPLLSWLAQTRASRKTTVVAFGGGVIGDLVGFVASSYMRGVPFYQIPTSLLSQVDSSVGGKVGIDLVEGKNLAGAFYPPVGVTISMDILKSLPERQFINGMAEVWKYGFIMDADLVTILETTRLDAHSDALGTVVKRCIELKAQVVEADEFETLGLRAILNFGHTIGHAIEYATGYGAILHGEAISIGMVAEARLGEILGITPLGTTEIVSSHLSKQGLPTTSGVLRDEDRLVQAMYGDKKSVGGQLSFSLLTKLGACKLIDGVPEDAVRAALKAS